MRNRKINLSTMQIGGTLTAIFVGVLSSLLGTTIAESLILGLLIEILSISLDIYYNSIDHDETIAKAIQSDPVLKNYEYCIYEHRLIKDTFCNTIPGTIGSLLCTWLDERILVHHNDIKTNWKNGRVVFPAQEVEEKSIQVQKRLERGGFATQLERYTPFWDSAEAYLKINRDLALEGKEITRVFILQSESSLQNRELIRQIQLDSRAGITTMIAFTEGANRIEDQEAIKDFGIWDDKLLCIISLSPQTLRVTGSTYSIIDTDLSKAQRWQDHILFHAVSSEVYLDSLD